MTREVLEGIGGIHQVVAEGEKVFIKPNLVTLPWAGQSDVFATGECTKPEIVAAVAEECLRAGAAEVVIGEGSQMPRLNWSVARTLDGSTNLAREVVRLAADYGRPVRVASLEVDSPEWVDVPSRTHLGSIAISSFAAHADRVISIPVAKTHCWAQLSLSLKNFLGVTPLRRYAAWAENCWDRAHAFDHTSPRAIAEIYLDIVDALRPDLAIVDCSIGIEGAGPTMSHGGRTVDMRERLGSWLLLGSTDLVAADATAARIMSHDPASLAHLQLGYDMGLGELREDRIEVLGWTLDDLRVDWAVAQLKARL